MSEQQNEKPKNPAAVALGKISSEKKRTQALKNLASAQKTRRQPRKPLSEIICSCKNADAKESLDPAKHLIRCLRGRAIRYRLDNNFPLD